MKCLPRTIILSLFLLLTVIPGFADGNISTGKDNQQKLSVSMDFQNSSMIVALNAEYSPNKFFDFGMGISPFSFFLFPAVEVHALARVCFLDYFIQPYIQVGVSYVAPGQMDDNENFLNARVGTGVKVTIFKNFYFGVGGGYSFAGQNIGPSINWQGLYPAAFLGYTAVRF